LPVSREAHGQQHERRRSGHEDERNEPDLSGVGSLGQSVLAEPELSLALVVGALVVLAVVEVLLATLFELASAGS
jgi:hypothetical protein